MILYGSVGSVGCATNTTCDTHTSDAEAAVGLSGDWFMMYIYTGDISDTEAAADLAEDRFMIAVVPLGVASTLQALSALSNVPRLRSTCIRMTDLAGTVGSSFIRAATRSLDGTQSQSSQ